MLAIEPKYVAPDFGARLHEQLDRLAFDYRVHVPGIARGKAGTLAKALGIDVSADTLRRIAKYADRNPV